MITYIVYNKHHESIELEYTSYKHAQCELHHKQMQENDHAWDGSTSKNWSIYSKISNTNTRESIISTINKMDILIDLATCIIDTYNLNLSK